MGSQGGGAAWPVRSGLVPSLAAGFSARADTAADLGAALVTGALVALVPARIAGERPGSWLESCGKTQLAVCVAETLWRSRRLELLVWVTATDRASVLSGYAEAAAAVLGGGDCGDAESAAARFTGWLGETRRPWLVVFDDLRDRAVLDGLRPSGPAGSVLITTADPAALAGEQQALVHPVGVFSPAEALSFLAARLPEGHAPPREAAALAAELGYEPLALAQASAVITSGGLSCRDYLDWFTRQRERLGEAGSVTPAAGSVTWTVSAAQADRLAPGGAVPALLALAAMLAGQGTPREVFTTAAACEHIARPPAGTDGEEAGTRADDRLTPAGTGTGTGDPLARTGTRADDPLPRTGTGDPLARTGTDSQRTAAGAGGEETGPGRVYAALRAAERAGLLVIDLGKTAALVRMSPVVQAAVRAGLPEGMLSQAAAAAAGALFQAWPGDERPPWLTRALRSCTSALQQAAGDQLWAAGCPPALLRAGRSLDRARLTGPAVAYWSELAAASDRNLGRGHPDTLAIGERMAAAHQAAGQAGEAVWWLRWVLGERVRVLGPDHPRAISARRDLGRALTAAGQPGEAITTLGRAVSDGERTRGHGQPETLAAQDELAAAYQAAGEFADAIRLFQGTLAEREQVQGPDHPDTITTRYLLAGACLADGRYRNALSAYKRALADRERVLGTDHPDTIAARHTLGAAYHAAGRMAAALQLFEQACAGYQQVLGADQPRTLACCADLAHTYEAVGRVTDAVALFRDTLARCERALPPGDPLTGAVRQSLAGLAGG